MIRLRQGGAENSSLSIGQFPILSINDYAYVCEDDLQETCLLNSNTKNGQHGVGQVIFLHPMTNEHNEFQIGKVLLFT